MKTVKTGGKVYRVSNEKARLLTGGPTDRGYIFQYCPKHVFKKGFPTKQAHVREISDLEDI